MYCCLLVLVSTPGPDADEEAEPVGDDEMPTHEATGARKALVIGINNYSKHPLNCCVNDARKVHAKLERMGFDSNVYVDLTFQELQRRTREFRNSLSAGDVAFFYFAGHGVEAAVYQGEHWETSNWLLGRAVPEVNEDLPQHAINAHSLLREIEAKSPRFSFIVLDCCRDNPLSDTRSLGGDRPA